MDEEECEGEGPGELVQGGELGGDFGGVVPVDGRQPDVAKRGSAGEQAPGPPGTYLSRTGVLA
jgi:hypothetical protein